jgi:SAM-dependent methyltransferase
VTGDETVHDGAAEPYAKRLEALERRWVARVFDVQRPYRRNIRRLEPGFVLDVGCGLGRNLTHLDGNGVGIDADPVAVETARARGLTAFTPEGFAASEYARPGRFDSLLMAHVLEHLTSEEADGMLRRHLPYVRPGGQVILICPQESGFRSDPTHRVFLGPSELDALARQCGVAVRRTRSFPFPRAIGRVFRYNETVLVGDVPG